MNALGLYVHIPFCVRKCNYCDFLSAPSDEKTREAYVDMLCREIAERAPFYDGYLVHTVFLGGGTPTVMTPKQLATILQALRTSFHFAEENVEISLECNPGTVDAQALTSIRRAGFNRLSIGLQSAQDSELKLLGRIHTYEQFLDTFQNARAAGFDNINVDLMSALPGQSLLSYQDTLQKVLHLRPEHISAYSLIIEEGTPFYDKYHEADEERARSGQAQGILPSEDDEREMYYLTDTQLKAEGYHRYEISNYALSGKECVHNCVYWQRGEYLGLGIGAASLVQEKRWKNTESLSDYLQGDFSPKEKQALTIQDRMEEFMFLGLRMIQGVSVSEFERCFGHSFEEVYGKTAKELISEGLLLWENDTIRLTEKGIDVSNMVFAQFMIS